MNTDSIYKYIRENLSEKRFRHTMGVVKTAKELAAVYCADMEKAEFAALAHDMFKMKDIEKSDAYVRKLGLGDYYLGKLNLAHGRIAAEILKREYSADEDIVNAVKYHTTGRADMSLLEKIIYLADAIEPSRDYPGVETLRELAPIDLDEACLLSMERTVEFLQKKGSEIDSDTLEARDYLNERKKIREQEINR